MSAVSTHDRALVLRRFRDLTPEEQLAVYREIRDYLGARIRPGKRDLLVDARAESLDAMRQVATHLGLSEGEPPTPAQFDAGCRELGLPWNRGRFTRTWGRWRFGRDVFLGIDHDTAARRNLYRALDDRRLRTEGPLKSLQMWLATNPPDRHAKTYRRWAEEHNAQVGAGELRVSASAYNLSRKLGLTWADAVRYAAGEVALADAAPPRSPRTHRICRGPYDLVTMKDVATILGRARSDAYRDVHGSDFPAPVIELPSARLWLRSDVEAYAAGERVPGRAPNELRHHYMTVPEVCAATGLTLSKLRSRSAAPTPAVLMSRVRLWLREEIEEWVAAGGARSVA